MSSKFSPRRRLQQTPAVCLSTNPPLTRPPNYPYKFALPDVTNLFVTFPIVPALFGWRSQWANPIRRQTPGGFTWQFEPQGPSPQFTIDCTLREDTGQLTIGGRVIGFPGLMWFANFAQYSGPWSQFDTGNVQLAALQDFFPDAPVVRWTV